MPRAYTKHKFLGSLRLRARGFIIAASVVAIGLTVAVWTWRRNLSESKDSPAASAQAIQHEPGSQLAVPRIHSATANSSVNAIDAFPSNDSPASAVRDTNAQPVQTTERDATQAISQLPLTSQQDFATRPPRNIYETQVALVRRGFSPGCLDGVLGSQTRAALRAFQEREHLPITGDLDNPTKARLTLSEPPEKIRVVGSNDLGRLTPVGRTWLEKSQQARLDYETILELLAEEGQAHPNLVRMLNPSVNWTNIAAGTPVRIPNVRFPAVRGKAAMLQIRLGEKILRAWDSNSNLLVQFPCSIARRLEKRPLGQLLVDKVASNPNYRFDPEGFPESAEARRLKRTLLIRPGPNNPVGTAWIRLNRPGYGIHGTPRPEEVGRTESHGCFRLANWSADYLAKLVRAGTPVLVEP